MRKDFRNTSSMIEDRFFYGRETELRIIHNNISIRQHTAIFAQRQIGKTATIHKAIEQYTNKPLKAHIDLSRKSSMIEASKILIDSFMNDNFGMKNFLVYLLHDFNAVINKVLTAPALVIEKIKLKDYELELKELQISIAKEINGTDLFAKIIEFIDAVATDNNKAVVLFIDEFQRLMLMTDTRTNWEEELWKIRSAIQDTTSTAVIIVGSQPTSIKNFISSQSSPFFNGFITMSISPIKKEFFMSHFKEVCTTYNVSDNEILTGFAYDICGGIPSYLSLFGRNLFDEIIKRKIELEANLYFYALEKTISGLSSYFKLLEKEIDEVSYGIASLKAIYLGKNPVNEVLKLSDTSKANIHNNTLKKLSNRGFINNVKRGDYEVTDRLFGLYISESTKADQLKILFEDRINNLLLK